MQSTSEIDALGYNGLTEHTQGLPADAYYDPRQYERELQRIWYRNWVYVGRSSDLARHRAFRTFELGDQKILLVRDDQGAAAGLSQHLPASRGGPVPRIRRSMLRAGTIICPYHAWVYNLQGDLLRTSSKAHASGFDVADYPLYKISVREWNGFIFVALDRQPAAVREDLRPAAESARCLAARGTGRGPRAAEDHRSNWKIFWENYNECLHCPGVHPQLSQLVPIYGRGLLEERDDPQWRAHAADADPKFKGGLRSGAATWSLDGKITGIPFPGLSEADREAGHIYMTSLPSVFLVGHIDYVRVVRLLPLGPERTELRVEYLFSPQTLADPAFDMRNVVDFTNTVMTEDAQVCELNQRGLRAGPHVRGVVMPEEYVIRQFHDWVRAELARV
jgi:Rieske 2Fe-2S family protein